MSEDTELLEPMLMFGVKKKCMKDKCFFLD